MKRWSFDDVVVTLHFRVMKKDDSRAEGIAQEIFRQNEVVCVEAGIDDGAHLLAHVDQLIADGKLKPRKK